MHKDKNSNGGKLKCGPIWDYNFTFGNADYYSAWSTSGWHLYTEFRDDPFQIPFWWKKLMMDKIFTNRIARRWADLRQNIFSNQHILEMTDSLSSLLAESQVRNFNKWKILGTYVWPNYFIGNTFESEINYLKSWVNYRLNWLDSIIPKDFSYVNWKDNDEFIINIEPNSSVDILVSDFYKETVNVDHFTVVVNNPEITASFINNAIHIESGNAGEFGIKLVGWKGNEKRELSQTYKVLVGISDVDDGKVPIDFSLSQNYPNPFNPSTTISFTIPSSTEYYSVLQNVTLKVYDILGREVATLVDENKPAGVYNVKCIMNNVNSAIYFYTLKAGSFFQTKKMMLIK